MAVAQPSKTQSATPQPYISPGQPIPTPPNPLVDEAATSASKLQRRDTQELHARLQGSEGKVAKTPVPVADEKVPDILSSRTIVLATYDGGAFTNVDLTSTLVLRKPREFSSFPNEQILKAPLGQLRLLVTDYVYELALYDAAKKAGITEETSGIKERLQNFRNDALNRIYFEQEIAPQMVQRDEKSAREYYDQNKDKLYTAPEAAYVRNLHLSFFKPYIVKAGETLKQIAERESGDAAAASRILRGDPLHYPRMPLNPDKVPFEDARAGEPLLVPLKNDDVTSKRRLANELAQRVRGGEDFGKLTEQYSEVETPAEKMTFQPDYNGMQANVRDAVQKLGAGTSFTQPLEGKYGIDLFKLEEYRTSHTLTFEEVKDKIMMNLAPEQRRQSMNDIKANYVDRLGTKYGISFNTEVLKRVNSMGDNPITANTVIASAPDLTYTFEEYHNEMAQAMKGWTTMSYEERLNFAKASPRVVNYLVRRDAEKAGLDKTPGFESEMKSKAIIEVTSEYLRKMNEGRRTPPEDELRKYYNAHLDRYTSDSLVTVREIAKRVELSLPSKKKESIETAKKQLEEIRASIHSQEDFERLARRESEALSTRSRGGLIGTVPMNFRGDVVKNQLSQLKPGDVSEPFLYGQEMMILRLDSMLPPTVVPFEQALPRVRSDYLLEVPRRQSAEDRQKVLKDAHFELKF